MAQGTGMLSYSNMHILKENHRLFRCAEKLIQNSLNEIDLLSRQAKVSPRKSSLIWTTLVLEHHVLLPHVFNKKTKFWKSSQ